MIEKKNIVAFSLGVALTFAVVRIFTTPKYFGESEVREIPSVESTVIETLALKVAEESNNQHGVADYNSINEEAKKVVGFYRREESGEKETTRLESMLKKNLELLLDAIEGRDLNDIDNCLSVSITCYELLTKAYEAIEEKVPEPTRENFQSIFRHGLDCLESEGQWEEIRTHEQRIESLGFSN